MILKFKNKCLVLLNFHQLKGDRKGTWSMHVSGNWVLTFRFDGQNVTDVDFEDYH